MGAELPSSIGIAGLGLIGGSLAQALAAAWPGVRRIGHDTDPAVLQRALQHGVIDEAQPRLDALLLQVPLLVLCQPVAALIDSLAVAGRSPRLPVLCDVASVKAPVLAAAQRALGSRRGRFVPTHPIAGKAQGGLAAAEPGLFSNRPLVLCADGADADARAAVKALWRATGARVVVMDATLHDEVYATLSHLPQMLTWLYLQALAAEPWHGDAALWAGPGFQSFTRLGRSNPGLWADIVIQNRQPLLARLRRVGQDLDDLCRALERGQVDELTRRFEAAGQGLAPEAA